MSGEAEEEKEKVPLKLFGKRKGAESVFGGAWMTEMDSEDEQQVLAQQAQSREQQCKDEPSTSKVGERPGQMTSENGVKQGSDGNEKQQSYGLVLDHQSHSRKEERQRCSKDRSSQSKVSSRSQVNERQGSGAESVMEEGGASTLYDNLRSLQWPEVRMYEKPARTHSDDGDEVADRKLNGMPSAREKHMETGSCAKLRSKHEKEEHSANVVTDVFGDEKRDQEDVQMQVDRVEVDIHAQSWTEETVSVNEVQWVDNGKMKMSEHQWSIWLDGEKSARFWKNLWMSGSFPTTEFRDLDGKSQEKERRRKTNDAAEKSPARAASIQKGGNQW